MERPPCKTFHLLTSHLCLSAETPWQLHSAEALIKVQHLLPLPASQSTIREPSMRPSAFVDPDGFSGSATETSLDTSSLCATTFYDRPPFKEVS